MHGNCGQFIDGRNFPGLRAVSQVTVRQNNHRNHVFDGDAAGLQGNPETIPGRRRSNNRNGRLGISSVQGLQQIRLLGFGRKAGRRAAALDVADYERQLHGDSQAERFGLERHARTGGGGDAKRTGISSADGRGNRGDFVLGLKGDYAEILVLRQLVQNVRSGSDWIRAQKKRDARLLRSGDKA